VGLEWFCGKGRLEEDYGGILWHSKSYSLELGLKAFFWRCGCVTLEKG